MILSGQVYIMWGAHTHTHTQLSSQREKVWISVLYFAS